MCRLRVADSRGAAEKADVVAEDTWGRHGKCPVVHD